MNHFLLKPMKVTRFVPLRLARLLRRGAVSGAALTCALSSSFASLTGELLPALNPEAALAELESSLASVPTIADLGGPVLAVAPYPRAGWQTVLSTRAHGVRGTVTIVDADTFRVDNFFYDGGGIDVHFILAPSDDFTSYNNGGLLTELNLLGMPFNGGSITIDLPAGTTFDGHNAISLWCVPARANFGSGTFANPAPEPSAAILLLAGLATLGSRLRPRAAQP